MGTDITVSYLPTYSGPIFYRIGYQVETRHELGLMGFIHIEVITCSLFLTGEISLKSKINIFKLKKSNSGGFQLPEVRDKKKEKSPDSLYLVLIV